MADKARQQSLALLFQARQQEHQWLVETAEHPGFNTFRPQISLSGGESDLLDHTVQSRNLVFPPFSHIFLSNCAA